MRDCQPPPYCGECPSCRRGIEKTMRELSQRESAMTTTPETPALLGDLTDETIERAITAVLAADTIIPDGGDPRGDAEKVVRAALAAARVAPLTPSEQDLGHDRDDLGICRRCRSGLTAAAIVDGEPPCQATAPSPDRESLAQLIQNAEDGDLCSNGWNRAPGPAQRRAADAIIAEHRRWCLGEPSGDER